jgi:hypothetical protein
MPLWHDVLFILLAEDEIDVLEVKLWHIPRVLSMQVFEAIAL